MRTSGRSCYSEEHTFAVVLKGIEEHRDVVVVEYVFAPREMTANLAGVAIVAYKDKIEGAPGVPQPYFGLFGRRLAVVRRVLNETR